MFIAVRWYLAHEPVPFTTLLSWTPVWGGQILFPILMLGAYWLSGYYNNVFGKSRLQELLLTGCTASAGTLIIFFLALVNDVHNRSIAYLHLLILFGLLFSVVYAARLSLTSWVTGHIHQRIWQFNTLIVGTGAAASAIARRLDNMKKSMGFKVTGYVAIPGEPASATDRPVYRLNDIAATCRELDIRYLILMPEHADMEAVSGLLNKLYELDRPLLMPPDLLPIPTMKRHLSNIVGEPLINIAGADISPATLNIKRLLDVTVSVVALILASPVMAALAIAVKATSPGPAIYRQTRIGYHRRKFDILKFRSMRVDAESASGPALSLPGDPRITAVGRFMRKYRLDELPQFWNVIRGEMSLVGPRPEREFFVKQIVARVPAYTLLHQLRPGITSWGMVKYGYAGNVDAMVERLRYDLLYLENVSLLIDMKVLFYTIHTVITGKGV